MLKLSHPYAWSLPKLGNGVSLLFCFILLCHENAFAKEGPDVFSLAPRSESSALSRQEELTLIRKKMFGESIDSWLKMHDRVGSKEALLEAVAVLEKAHPWDSPENDASFGVSLIRYAVQKELYLGTQFFETFLSLLKEYEDKDTKKKIPKIALPVSSFVSLTCVLHHSKVQEYVRSQEFRSCFPEDKLAALVDKMQSLSLPLESENLAHIYSALPAILPGGAEKREIHKVDLPLRVFKQLRAALGHPEIVDYLKSEGFKTLSREDKLPELLDKIQSLSLPLDSENLGSIYTGLPAILPGGVKKKGIHNINLPLRVFKQVRKALFQPEVSDFLKLGAFKALSREDKLPELVDKILALSLPLDSENLSQIHTALPAILPGDVKKKGIHNINLPLRIFKQVRPALLHPEVFDFLKSEAFITLSREDKLAALVDKIQSLSLPLDSDNLGNIYSALPAILPGGVKKSNIQAVDLPLGVFKQVRAALVQPELVDYLKSGRFKTLSREDKLAALVDKIQSLSLPLDSENLGQIYSALPETLSGKIQKKEIQFVQIPLRVFHAFRETLLFPQVQSFLSSRDFRELPEEVRLETLVLLSQTLNRKVTGTAFDYFYSALPATLGQGITKEDFRRDGSPNTLQQYGHLVQKYA